MKTNNDTTESTSASEINSKQSAAMLPKEAAFHWLYPLIFRAFSPLAATLVRFFAPNLRVTGRRNIPFKGATIFVANHISDADPLMMGLCLRRPLHWMAKEELWEWRSVAPFITFFGAFPVDPTSPDRGALRQAEAILKANEGLAMFPEGEISLDGELGKLMPGAVMLALKSGARVIPVGIEGTQHVIPYAKLWPRPTLRRVRFHFGPCLDFQDLAELGSREARKQATQRLEEALQNSIRAARS